MVYSTTNLPTTEEIEASDEIDATPAEFYARRAAKEAQYAASDSRRILAQRNSEYNLIIAALMTLGVYTVAKWYDARL